MKFYTNVYKYGDKLLVREKDGGVSTGKKVDYQPTLYVSSNDKNSDSKTLEGYPVAKVNPGSMNDCRDFMKKYEGVHNFKIYGNTNYVSQYISDEYRSEIDWDYEQLNVLALDIETTVEEGFPNIETANEEILLITLKNNVTKKVVTFGSRPTEKTIPNYILCNDETHLLKEFIIYWQQNYPDVVTGWNSEMFDIPYLVRRIDRQLGETFTKKLSPWGVVKQREVFIKGNKEFLCDIAGVSSLDYLQLYQKYQLTKRESYKLDAIAEIELKRNKLENPYENFRDFYTLAWDTFVEYNQIDTELVDELEDTMKFIVLHLTIAYQAKVNYNDVFSPVKVWEMIIYNYLRDKDVVIPQRSSVNKSEQFEGAYVKDPLIGYHKWVASFDLNSLYPHLIMQYNMSPETLTDLRLDLQLDDLINAKADLSVAKEKELAVTANGWCYRKDVRGFLPILMEKMYKDRKAYKDKSLELKSANQKVKDPKVDKEVSRLRSIEQAFKILLNSAYGAVGNAYFCYFDLRIAEGITTSGQLSIRWTADRLNAFMNKTLKTTNKDYIIAIDTDSIYLSLETLVESTCEGKTTEQKIQYMDKVCEQIFRPFIDKSYKELAEYMNAYEQAMQMKREALADSAIWTAKKRYIINVHNNEGVQYSTPEAKVMGLEMIKSSTPALVRQKLKETIPVVLHGSQLDLQNFVQDYYNEFIQTDLNKIARPSGVNGLKQYTGSPIYAKGTPMHVRASLLFNHHIKRLKLDKKYPLIREGDKIKYVSLKMPNPIQEDVIAFVGSLPKEFELESYIDYDKMFEKVFEDALQIVIEPLGWKTRHQSSLEEFF